MEGRERKTSITSQRETLNNTHSHCSIPTQHHQAHKMVALKKAYAEVILNTAKEAASRVMASERRALRFRQELASAKDEALHVLLRLKHMIDAKTAEAEMTSLNQQRKIEELEAQLNEAEDVITDLRAELKHVCLELEKTRNRQVQYLDGRSVMQFASFQESVKSQTLASSPNKEVEFVTSCDVKNKSLTVNVLDGKCCNSKKETQQLRIADLEDYYVHDSDFTSFIKEAELCKIGFAQRIHALEENLLDGLVKDSENGKVAKCNAPSSRTEKMEMKKHAKCHKKPKRKIFSCCRSCFLSSCKKHINESCKSNKGVCSQSSVKPCAINKWKRKRRRHRHVGMKSSVLKSCKPSFVLRQCSFVCDNGNFFENEHAAKMKPVPPLTNVESVHGSTGVTESVQAVKKTELVEKAIEKDSELLNLEGYAARNLTGPSSNMKVEVVDIPSTNADLEDAKAFEENDGSPGQVNDSRLLKYTFQRKRRKDSLVNLDETIDSEKSNSKRRVEDPKKGHIRSPEMCMMDEPSGDSYCLAQVAHQLISLSSKRW